MDIEKGVFESFIGKGLTLSVAESCTGGDISARLTRIAGASRYFLGGVVSYSNEVKMGILGVKKETLETFGAVSGEVVREMLKGILELTGSDYAVAISGVAGPDGGTLEIPVGTLWGGVRSRKGLLKVWRFSLSGDRREIIHEAGTIVLEGLLECCG